MDGMFRRLLDFWNILISNDRCYTDREAEGIAVFGMCGGVVGGDNTTGYLAPSCVSCKYYVNVIPGQSKRLDCKNIEQGCLAKNCEDCNCYEKGDLT